MGGIGRLLLLIVSILLIVPATVWGRATIDAQVDRTTLGATETLRLRIRISTDLADGPGDAQVQAPNLNDWEVVSQMQQQNVVNTASTQVITLTLQPRKGGRLTIGPFVLQADGKPLKTKPIAVTVTGQPTVIAPPPQQFESTPEPATPAPSASTTGLDHAPDPDAFLAWEVSKRQAWLGEQLEATLYLYVRRGLAVVQHDFGSIAIEGFWTETLQQNGRDANFVPLDGNYYVRSPVVGYRLFPLRAGTATLPSVHADLVLADRSLFGGRRTRQSRDAAPLTLEVKALPVAGQPPGFQGPAVGRVTLQTNVDRTRIQANDGVQVTVTTTVDGLIGNVPELEPTAPDWHVFPPTHTTQTGMRGGTMYGTRTSRFLLKPLKGGTLTVPEFTLPYFDPTTGTYAVATSQRMEVQVIGEPRPEAPQSAPTAASQAGGKSGANGKGNTKADADLPTLRGIRTQSSLSRSTGEPWQSPLFPLSVLLPPLLWLGLVGRQRWQLHTEAGAEGRAVRRAAQEAKKGLDRLLGGPPQREAYSEVSRLLVSFLEVRLGLTLRGLTSDAQRRRLAGAGLPADLVQGLGNELESCDFARFAPGDLRASDLQETIRRAAALTIRVDREAKTP